MKNLSLTKGRQPTKAERKKAAGEESKRRAMAKCPIPVPKKPERKPLSKKPREAPEPGKIYTAAEREKLIESRPDLQNEMEVWPQDK